jgi:hypothetical protein
VANDYAGPDFQAFGLEMWNGSNSQTLGFKSSTGITYPCLLGAQAAGVGTAYACTYDIFFVVGGDGLITLRWQGWSETRVRNAIEAALDDLTTSAEDLPGRDGFRLHAAYPNPFNPATNIAYTIAGEGDAPVDLRIIDVRGRTVRTLVNGRQAAGQDHVARWDGLDDAGRPAHSGTYLAALTVRGETQSRFLTLVK